MNGSPVPRGMSCCIRHLAGTRLGLPICPSSWRREAEETQQASGAQCVREYRDKGYLPQALFNFLLLLGWSPGTDRELFTPAEAAREFTMERINASPVALSFEKLDWFNGVYIRSLEWEELAKRCLPHLQQTGLIPDPCPEERYRYLVQLMPLVRERLKSIPEISDLAGCFLQNEIPVPSKELLIPKKMDALQSLQALQGALEALNGVDADFKEVDLEQALRNMTEKIRIARRPSIHAATGGCLRPNRNPGDF